MSSQKTYELSFVNKEEDCSSVLEELNRCKFSVLEEGSIKKIKLAYPIKKNNFAYFGYLRFGGGKNRMTELKKRLTASPNLLRFLIISLREKHKENENKRS